MENINKKVKNLLIDDIMGKHISKKKVKKIIVNYTKNFTTRYPSPVEITRLLCPSWRDKMLVNILLNCNHIYVEIFAIEIIKYYGKNTIYVIEILENISKYVDIKAKMIAQILRLLLYRKADYDLIEYYYKDKPFNTVLGKQILLIAKLSRYA